MKHDLKYLFIIVFIILFQLIFSCKSIKVNHSHEFQQAQEIKQRVDNYYSSNVNYIKWDSRLINSAYSDTDYTSYTCYFNPAESLTYITRLLWDVEFDTSVEYFFGKENEFYEVLNQETQIYYREYSLSKDSKNTECVIKKKFNWINNVIFTEFIPGSHPYANEFEIDTNKNNITIKQTAKGDTMILSSKKGNGYTKLFVNNKGQICHYEDYVYITIAGIDIVQKIFIDNIEYKDTFIDFNSLYAIDTCVKIENSNVESNKFESNNQPDIDSFFLNKKFDFSSLSTFIDSSEFYTGNKIILLDYSFLSCFGCILAINQYGNILDSFGHLIKLVIVDPIDPKIRQPLVDKLLSKHRLIDRVDYHLVNEYRNEVTFNGVVQAYPTMLFIDKKGIVRHVKVGVNPDENLFDVLKEIILSIKNE